MLNTVNENNSHIYYNIDIETPIGGEKYFTAQFSENRTVPILNKCDDYEMAVIRFDLPTINIPIFFWKPNSFFVSIKYLTEVFTRELQFIQNENGIIQIYGDTIWQYQDFIDSINDGLLLCFQDFQADPIYLTIPVIDRPIDPPKMTYNGITKKCSIYFPLEYDINKTNPIYIYFSELLFTYFPAFQNFSNAIDQILSFYLKPKNNFNNTVVVNGKNYFKMTEEWKELFLWNDFQNIIFETDVIPVANEYIAGQKNITRKILTDFEPLVGINDRSNIKFYPKSNLRLMDMISSLELRQIDMRVFWQNKNGNVYPLYISKSNKLTMKLYFKKKGLTIENLEIF